MEAAAATHSAMGQATASIAGAGRVAAGAGAECCGCTILGPHGALKLQTAGGQHRVLVNFSPTSPRVGLQAGWLCCSFSSCCWAWACRSAGRSSWHSPVVLLSLSSPPLQQRVKIEPGPQGGIWILKYLFFYKIFNLSINLPFPVPKVIPWKLARDEGVSLMWGENPVFSAVLGEKNVTGTV